MASGIMCPRLDPRLIQDFLSDRSQQVLLDGVSSKSAPVQSGVSKWSDIGPLLFLFPDCVLPRSTARLLADGSVLYRPIKIMEDAIKVQEDLDKLQEWEKDWLMEFQKVPSVARNQQEKPYQEGLYRCI